MDLYFIKKEQQRLFSEQQALKEKLKKYPAGKIICHKSGKYTKWYHADGTQTTYLPKSEQNLIESLVCKRYCCLKLADVTAQLNLLDDFLNKYRKLCLKSQNFLLNENFRTALKPYMEQFSPDISSWIHAQYPMNQQHPDHLIHKTLAGHFVRSKSEVIIANCLYQNKIPYRYECLLVINEIQLFPDFTILHPITGAIYFWEHFGLMSKESYMENAYNKLKLYAMNDIFPGINLITTYETNENPIDSVQIAHLVSEFFTL